MTTFLDNPKISCLMATEGRPQLLQRAVRCYLNQTYDNKELVILSQGSEKNNKMIKDFIFSLERDDIKFLAVPQSLTLGAVRNLSVETSTGDIVCQWDDDDLYHSQRLATQFFTLQNDDVIACFYDQHLKYFSNSEEMYWVKWENEEEVSHRYLPGSCMFWKKVFYKYKNKLYPEKGDRSNKEEDLDVLEKFLNLGKVCSNSEGYQYVYVFHGQNTYSLPHHELILKKPLMSVENLLKNQSLLINVFQELGITEHVKVRSLDEIAFEYQGE